MDDTKKVLPRPDPSQMLSSALEAQGQSMVTFQRDASGKLMAFRTVMEPLEQVLPTDIFGAGTFELICSGSSSKALIDGMPCRTEFSLWTEGDRLYRCYVSNYAAWNMAMLPEYDSVSGSIIMRAQHNNVSDKGLDYNKHYADANSTNFRTVILAKEFGVDAILIMARSSRQNNLNPNKGRGESKMTYYMFGMDIKNKKLKKFPICNIYPEESRLCVTPTEGKYGLDIDPSRIFSDLENSPGNLDLLSDLHREVTGTIREDPPDDPSVPYSPWVYLKAPATTLRNVSANIPPIWGSISAEMFA